ncbi:hypothetical protein [Maribacter sp. 2307ULW6-5]|uniref:hypothetical protein n=1 Tax=Maribacter sp. 2307ULW6-5 TaxID=3386275 RepID=UPI0039BC2919
MILVFRHIFYKNYVGLSFWPFILVKHPKLRQDTTLINHEKIHLRQQLELLVVPFYIWYLTEWALRTLWYLDAYRAYRNICFEREAYANEGREDYLRHRRPFGFLRYVVLVNAHP